MGDRWAKVRQALKKRDPAEAAPIEALRGGEDLTVAECELVAMRGLLADLVRAVEALAPGRFDRPLQETRVRLAAIEAGRIEPIFPSEDLVLRSRINLIERGQGRETTQG